MNTPSMIGMQVDQYKIESHIARGGMADVYLARDVRLDRLVAFKILLSMLAQDAQYVKRFQREAQAVARLDHPNIVKVYSTGLMPAGQPYIAMQYVQGGSMRDQLLRWQQQGKVAPAPQSLAIMRHLGSALDTAHRAGIVHRDLKPSNVLIRPNDGTPILVDLGIAAIQGGEKLTQTGSLIGTPHYMSPEQVRGEKVDGRSDIYSLGVILYELLAGVRPFEADESIAILHKHVYESPPPIDQLRPGLSGPTLHVVNTCLQKDPASRFQTAEGLTNAIDRALQVEGQQGYILKTTVLLPEGEGELISRSRVVKPPASPVPPKQKRSKLWLALVAVLALVVMAGVLVLNILGSDEPPATDDNLPLTPVVNGESGPAVVAEVTETIEIIAANDEPIIPTEVVEEEPTFPAVPPTESATPPDVPITPTPTEIPITPTPTVEPEIGLPETYVGKDGALMLLVPEGEFLMGSTGSQIDEAVRLCQASPDRDSCSRSEFDSESPPRRVFLSSFYVDENEITNEQYSACVNSGRCNQLPGGTGRYRRSEYYDDPTYANYPVVWVSWYNAKDYCVWAGKRLPTEAEWEKAARGEDGLIFPWGDFFGTEYANTQDRGGERITKVGEYLTGASPYGVLDMAGNVWEYVADWFDPDYYREAPASNPQGPASSPNGHKVLRSGSYANYQHYARAANRGSVPPDSSTQFAVFVVHWMDRPLVRSRRYIKIYMKHKRYGRMIKQFLLWSAIGMLLLLLTSCDDVSPSGVSSSTEEANPLPALTVELLPSEEAVISEAGPAEVTVAPPTNADTSTRPPVLPPEYSSMQELQPALRWLHDRTSPVSMMDFISTDDLRFPYIVAVTEDGQITTLSFRNNFYWETSLSNPPLALAVGQVYGRAHGDVAVSTEANGIQLLELTDQLQQEEMLWHLNAPGNVTAMTFVDATVLTPNAGMLVGTDNGLLLGLDTAVPPQSTTPIQVGDTAVKFIELLPGEAGTGSIVVLTEAGNLSIVNEAGEMPLRANLNASASWLLTTDLNDDGQLEIVVSTANGEVIAFDQAGTELWRWQSDYPVEALTSVRFENGTRVLASSDGRLAALTSNGESSWHYQFSDSPIMTVDSGDVDADGRVEMFIGSDDGNIWILDEDGRIRGKYDVETPLSGFMLVNLDENSPQPELVVWAGPSIFLYDVIVDDIEAIEPETSTDHDVELDEVALSDLPQYDMDVLLDVEAHRAEVQQATTVKNTSDDPWDELVFHISPDFWQGIFELNEVLVHLDGVSTAVTRQPSQAAKLHIPLPRPVDPGEEVKVEINFALNLPQLDPYGWGPTGNAGWGPGIIQMGDWYPALVPYQSGSGWQTWQFTPVGDPVISRLADFDVKIHPSADVTIAAPGHQQDLEDGGQRFRLDGARAFSYLTSPNYVSQGAYSNDGVPVTVYTTERYKDAGAVVLDTAVRAMNLFSQLYGPYPYEELIIAENGFLTAMEYSGLVSLSGFAFDSYDGSNSSLLVAITAHEVAHQWWYGAVGNDQVREPWIDEGLAMMSEFLFYEAFFPSLTEWWWDFRVDRWNPVGFVDQSTYEFSDSERFVHNVYGMASYFMYDLRNEMGDEAFKRFLHDFLQQNQDGFVSGEDFFAAVRAHTDKDITPLIEKYFRN